MAEIDFSGDSKHELLYGFPPLLAGFRGVPGGKISVGLCLGSSNALSQLL